ncbi:hypothetical protein M422DRAFT_65146 [Sphaerobolus stellatus SS14]|nr:hypothetical protein M422DRAFT_65146 [Sphaerobolus stellatus SS14]
MTSTDMEVNICSQIAAEQTRELEEAAAKQAKAAAALRVQEERILNKATRVFMGPIKVMKKSDLQALAYALDLVFEGTKEELASRILQQFEANVNLKEDVRFKGIFEKKKRGRKTKGANAAQEPDEETEATGGAAGGGAAGAGGAGAGGAAAGGAGAGAGGNMDDSSSEEPELPLDPRLFMQTS